MVYRGLSFMILHLTATQPRRKLRAGYFISGVSISNPLSKDDIDEKVYDAMINNEIHTFTAEGIIITQTTWSTIDKEFTTSFER